MPKVIINDTKGIHTVAGSGVEISSSLEVVGALYTGNESVTASVGGANLLNDGPVHVVGSAQDAHKIIVPLAKAAGQIMYIRNNSPNKHAKLHAGTGGGTLILNLVHQKTAILISTAAGDNWSGVQID
jgi:hypothetical protein